MRQLDEPGNVRTPVLSVRTPGRWPGDWALRDRAAIKKLARQIKEQEKQGADTGNLRRPVPEAIETLPLRALVAFGVRGLRRVRQLITFPPGTWFAGDVAGAIDATIRTAEAFAREQEVALGDAEAAASFILALAGSTAGDLARPGEATAAAATTAACQLSAAVAAARGHANAGTLAAKSHSVREHLCNGFLEAERAAGAVGSDPARVAFQRAGAADLQRLAALDLGYFPDPGGPIDPAETGPLGLLWPDGEPRWDCAGTGGGP